MVYSSVMMWRLATVFLLVFSLRAAGQVSPEKLNAITDRSKWTKAGQSIRKAMVKDTLDPEPVYLMSLFFFHAGHPTFQIDSASHYQHKSARLMAGRELGRRAIMDTASVRRFRLSIDSAAFERAKKADTEDAYQDFITRYASAREIPVAVELRDEQAFVKALKGNTSKSFKLFLQQYPSSHRSREAKDRMEKLEYEEITKDKRRTSYERFCREFPRSPYRPLAEKRVFELNTASGSPNAFLRFLKNYPESRWAPRAKALLFSLERDGEVVADGTWKTDSLRREGEVSEEGYWVPVIKSGRYGFINESGKEVVAPRFDDIPEGYRCGEISDRYLLTSEGILARNGKIVWKGTVKDFDDLTLGFIFITTDSGGFVIHESGYRLTHIPVDDALVIANRFVGINYDDRWTVMTLSGVPLLTSGFDDIAVLDSVVQLTKDNKKILTTPGRMARAAEGVELKEDFVFDDTRKWGDQHYWVRNGVLEGVIDPNLNFIIPLDRQVLKKTSFGFITTKNDRVYIQGIKKLEDKGYKHVVEQGGWVRMEDTAGKHWVFDRGFDTLTSGDSAWFRGQLAFLQDADSVRALLPDGQKIAFLRGSHFQFKEFRDSSAWMVLEEKKKKVVYNAGTGVRLFTAEFDQLDPVSPSLFLFTRQGKKGLIREDGKVLLPPEYDAIVSAGVHAFSLLKDKKFGWFDAATLHLVKPVYDRNVRPYNAKLWLAYKDKGYGFIHSDGKPVGTFGWDEVEFWNDSIAWAKKGTTWKLIEIASQKVRVDNIRQYQYLRELPTEKIALVHQDKVYGVLTSRRGTIIPIQYTEVINLGTRDLPLYFTERYITEAGISVVVYFDQHGKTIRSQALEGDELEKITCDN